MRFIHRTISMFFIFAVLFMGQNAYASSTGHSYDTAAIVFDDNTAYPVGVLDAQGKEGQITIYTRNYGERTRPFTAGTSEYIVADNIVVYINTDGERGTYIPSGGYVVSCSDLDTGISDRMHIGAGLELINYALPDMPDMYFELDGMVVPVDHSDSQRGAGEAVLYTPAYGESTETNAWGLELTIVDNVIYRITSMKKVNNVWADNNSSIPPNGVVVSIHTASPYYGKLLEKAKLGGSILIDQGNTIFYHAGKSTYAAYNPISLTDNPQAWDENNGKPYESFRGPNQLVIYDSSYGSHTGTNPFGYEVAVNAWGSIIKTGGNDSEIPEGGYVISGHGNKLKWLQKYALIGQKVLINRDKQEIAIIFTPQSYVDMAAGNLGLTQDRLTLAKKQLLDIPYEDIQGKIDKTVEKLKALQLKVDRMQFEGLVDEAAAIQAETLDTYYMTYESKKVEDRAVWLRPRETCIEEIRIRLDRLKELNINTVYLETYWNGYAIYPTGSSLLQHNPLFNGLDVLDAYIKEAHSRDMTLHAWVEDFLTDLPLAEKKPQWLAVSRKGDRYFLENGITKYYFLNPALPEVRSFLSKFYTSLVKTYALDGIQFDYLRYPHSGDYTNDFGYDSYTRQLFKSFTGTDPAALKPGDALWEKWCAYRTYLISSFAYETFTEIKALKSDVRISAAVWPDYDKTLTDIFQDPRSWVAGDYINNLISMSYYLNEAPVVDDAIKTQAFAKGHAQVTSGIATLTKVPQAILLRQVDAVRSADVNGIGIFEFESLFRGGYDVPLKRGAFRTPAVITHKDPELSLTVLLNDMTRKINEIYVPFGGMDAERAGLYEKKIGEINIDFGDVKAGRSRAANIKSHTIDILNAVNHDIGLNEHVKNRMISDLNNAVSILEAFNSGLRFVENLVVMGFQAELALEALKSGNETPVRIKAVLNNGTCIYLDSKYYTIKSDNPESLEIKDGMVRYIAGHGAASIQIAVSDAFPITLAGGLNRNFEFTMDPGMMALVENAAHGCLTASEISYTGVRLDWRGKVVDSNIAGYIVYRNGTQIAGVTAETFKDGDLEADTEYTYEIHGFDAFGKVIYLSNQIHIKTKAPFLISSLH